LNNAPENVQRLCRRCHMEADGRLAALKAHSYQPGDNGKQNGGGK
jgi:hypothetical protein